MNPRLREQRAWYFYDFANSAFATTVAAAFFFPYLMSMAKTAAGPGGFVSLLGIPLAANSIGFFTISASVAGQALLLPIFGAIADYGKRKKELLAVMAFLGACSTVAMFFLTGTMWLLGSALFCVANVCFGGGNIIYNSFLPEIATAEERDAVSSKGWGLGYAGGGLLLGLNLWLFSNASAIGWSESFATRVSLCSAGIWWGLFAIIPVIGLRNRGRQKAPPAGEHYIVAGTRQLFHTIAGVRRYPQTMLFLIGYLLYNDAIQTVLNTSSQFASDELHMSQESLAGALLLTQVVALAGALAFGRLALWIGNKRTVMLSLVVWCATLVYIYLAVHTPRDFFIAAAIIGTVMGGSQALSRSLYSFMIPKGEEAEYYSVSELSDKGSSWLAPLLMGVQTQITGSMRGSILSLIAFFLVGFVLLAKVDVRKAAIAAGNEPPAIA